MTQDEKASFLLNYCHISPLGLLTCLALAFCSLSWSQTPTSCLQPPVGSTAPGFGFFQKQDSARHTFHRETDHGLVVEVIQEKQGM